MHTDAEKLGFEVVESAISASGDYTVQEKRIVETAEEVTLRYKGRDILINTLTHGVCGISGRVSEVSNVCATTYEGVRLGQHLSFRYFHIQQTVRKL